MYTGQFETIAENFEAEPNKQKQAIRRKEHEVGMYFCSQKCKMPSQKKNNFSSN